MKNRPTRMTHPKIAANVIPTISPTGMGSFVSGEK